MNDAVNSNLFTIMLYSQNSAQPALTFKFTNRQTKDAAHSMIVRFTKTWSRTLSP